MNTQIIDNIREQRNEVIQHINHMVINLEPNRDIEKYLTKAKKLQKQMDELEKALEVLRKAGVEV